MTFLNSKFFKTAFLAILVAEVLSFLAWKFPVMETACFVAVMILVLILSLKKLEHGLYFIFAELFIGSKGYLFFLTLNGERFFSVRIGLFLVVMAVFLIKMIKKEEREKLVGAFRKLEITKIFLMLAIVVLWGLVWGLIRGNGFGNVFLDFNNWLYFLLLLPVLQVSDRKFIGTTINIMVAAVFWLGLKSLFLFYVFSHQAAWALPEIYKWVRDTGVGEITYVGTGIYRIFIQSQIYSLFLFFVLLFDHNSEDAHKKNGNYLLLIISFATVLISFSRSFWVGLAAGLFLYFSFLAFWRRPILEILKKFGKILLVAVFGVILALIVLKLPPKIDLSLLESFNSRLGTEAAGMSRINQLKPLGEAIIKHPLIGSGFGASATYNSFDPRIIPETAGGSGEITTYAFEWGYLDMVLKFGIVGLVVYLFVIFLILKRLVNVKTQMSNVKSVTDEENKNNYTLPVTHYPLQIGFALALIALLAVNIFSPYLNHPLGIGFIILSFALML